MDVEEHERVKKIDRERARKVLYLNLPEAASGRKKPVLFEPDTPIDIDIDPDFQPDFRKLSQKNFSERRIRHESAVQHSSEELPSTPDKYWYDFEPVGYERNRDIDSIEIRDQQHNIRDLSIPDGQRTCEKQYAGGGDETTPSKRPLSPTGHCEKNTQVL